MQLLDRVALARDGNLTLGTLLERLTTIHAGRRLAATAFNSDFSESNPCADDS